MPLTALDSRTALVLIDLQEGVAARFGRDTLAAPVGNCRRLAAGFRAQKLPVVLVRVAFSPDHAERPANRVGAGPQAVRPAVPQSQQNQQSPQPEQGRPATDLTALMPEVDQQPTDLVVTKRRMGAFHGTDLDLQLRSRAITGIVLAGVATSFGVESTARAAYDHGYNVTFASDAMTDFVPAAHDHRLQVTFPYFGEVDTTDAILAALDGR
jgi:nicotinamidase-related amidase